MERRSSRGRRPRPARRALVVILVLAGLLALSFALPIPAWRTGELEVPPLPLVRGGPPVALPRRVWIDTDAACGTRRTTDPDDCLALLLLAGAPGITVVGVSTVFGNAPLEVTDSVTRVLARRLRPDGSMPVYRGASRPVAERVAAREAEPGHTELRRALAAGPLTIVALGPLTNLAAALDRRANLYPNIKRVVAVMGRRPGHVFHPAEGAGRGMLLGHGPVFRDFNFAKDPAAAALVLSSGLPLTLVPYDAARQVSLDAGDLDALAHGSPAGAWVAERSREWLDYWRDDVGRNGFYPFDLVGAAWVVAPERFDCGDVEGWIGRDHRLWGWLGSPRGLMVGVPGEREPGAEVIGRVRYCPGLRPGLQAWLVKALTSVGARPEPREAGAPPASTLGARTASGGTASSDATVPAARDAPARLSR